MINTFTILTMEKFIHYPSIENTYNTKAIEYINLHNDNTLMWNATEKIHGANFSATTNGKIVKWGKRSSYIGDEGLTSFYNSQYIKEKYSNNILNLFNTLKAEHKSTDIEYIRLYGEICGGGYTNVKTSHPKSIKMVQKQIMYSPDIEFIVFDICVKTDYERYMNMTIVNNLCSEHNIPSVPILHVGTLAELMELSPIFQTTIPSLFSLPDLPNNMAEGYVFKPNTETYSGGHSRTILKHKSPAFTEKADNKVRIPVTISITEKHHEIIDKICMYINENRINNVISKIGDIETWITKKLIGTILQDVLKDALKDLTEEEIEFYKKEKKIIMPQIMFQCQQCYLEHHSAP